MWKKTMNLSECSEDKELYWEVYEAIYIKKIDFYFYLFIIISNNLSNLK